jgi:type I restriction enzyme, S subunit
MKKSWREKTLGEVLAVMRNGLNCKQTKSGVGSPISRIETISNGTVNLDRVGYAPISNEDKLKYRLRRGDILFSHINSAIHVGKTAILENEAELYHGVNLMLVRPSAELDEGFLRYFLQSLYYGGYWKLVCKQSVNQASVNQTDIGRVVIRYPQLLEEQKRIVAILDEAFEGLDRAAANAKRNLANARELFDSYLNAIFKQTGIEWIERKLGDNELTLIIDGDRGRNYPKKTDFTSDGYCLFLNTKNVRPDGFNFDQTMFISAEKDRVLGKGKLRRRDVIFTTRGTIGNTAVYDDTVDYDEIRINSGMLIFRPNEHVITSEYLFQSLRSGIIRSQIKRFATGAAQPQLPIGTLVHFRLPVPCKIGDQKALVAQLADMEAETNRLALNYERVAADLHELRQSILQKAFSGELTAAMDLAA